MTAADVTAVLEARLQHRGGNRSERARAEVFQDGDVAMPRSRVPPDFLWQAMPQPSGIAFFSLFFPFF